jgi:hypothetical protein
MNSYEAMVLMNDQTTAFLETAKLIADTETRVRRIFDSLCSALALDHVSFRTSFVMERDDLHDGARTLAEIHPDWCYETATLIVYVPMFVDMDDDEIAGVLIHEMGHYWLNPISRYGSSKEYDQLEEKVCTEIARAIKTAISTAGAQVADHWKLETKRLERELKKLRAQQEKEIA